MHVLRELLIFVIHSDTVPDAGAAVLVGELVKDTIASQNDKVVILRDLKRLDIWFTHDNIGIPPSEFKFRFGIPKCTRDRKSSRQDSYRSDYVVRIFTLTFLLSPWRYDSFFRLRHTLCGCGCLVDLATSSDDSLVLIWI